MNTKQLAVFFVTLLSFDYVTPTFFGHYKGVPKQYYKGVDGGENSGYYGWNERCQCDERLTSSLDRALQNARSRFVKNRKGFKLMDYSLEEYECNNGYVDGLHKFERKGPYRCSVSRNYARVIFRIGFFRLSIHYTISFVTDILETFLGGIGSFFGKIMGRVTDFFFSIFIPDVYVTVVLSHRFGSSQGFEVEGLYLNEIDKISFSDKRFSKHRDSFEGYFKPMCDHVLRNLLHTKLRKEFHSCFSGVDNVHQDMFYYKNSRKESVSYRYSSNDDDSSNDDSWSNDDNSNDDE